MVDSLKSEATAFQEKVENGTYPAEAASSGDFAMGISHFKVREWAEAEKYFGKAADSTDLKSPWRIWGRVYYGFCCDAQGRRDEAVKAYKQVLSEARRWTSHDNARKYSKAPFKGTDEELKKLSL